VGKNSAQASIDRHQFQQIYFRRVHRTDSVRTQTLNLIRLGLILLIYIGSITFGDLGKKTSFNAFFSHPIPFQNFTFSFFLFTASLIAHIIIHTPSNLYGDLASRGTALITAFLVISYQKFCPTSQAPSLPQ